MNITVSLQQGRVPVSVLHLEGQLDGQSFQGLIDKVRQVYNQGSRDVLLDITDLTYISSAGLVALHSAALLLRGETPPDLEQGWAAYRSMGGGAKEGKQEHIKLLNPRPEIISVLDMVGFATFFEVFTDLKKAVESF
jgi:anti-anti-sigma regulatory factor